MSPDERFAQALLDLKSWRVETRERGLSELAAIARDHAGTWRASAANETRVDFESRGRAALKESPLDPIEQKIADDLRWVNSWDSPQLRQLASRLPETPTSDFPRVLARSLMHVLDKLVMENEGSRVRLAQLDGAMSDIADRPAYSKHLGSAAQRMREYTESRRKADLLRAVEDSLRRGDLSESLQLLRNAQGRSVAVEGLLDEIERAAALDESLRQIEERPGDWSDWSATQDEHHRLAAALQSLNSRLSFLRQSGSRCLSEATDRLDGMLRERVEAAKDIAELRELGEHSSRANELANAWEQVLRGAVVDMTSLGEPRPLAMQRAEAELQQLLTQYAALHEAAKKGQLNLIDSNTLLAQSTGRPVLQSRIAELPEIARRARVELAMAEAFQSRDWPRFRASLQAAKQELPTDSPVLAGWTEAENHPDTLAGLEALSRELPYDTFAALIDWWRRWDESLVKLRNGQLLETCPSAKIWIGDIETESSRHARGFLASFAASASLPELERQLASIRLALGDRYAWIDDFRARITIRKLREQGGEALRTHDFIRLQIVLDALNAAGEMPIAEAFRLQGVLLRAKQRGAQEFARTILANRVELRRYETLCHESVREAIPLLWKESPPSLDLLRKLSSFEWAALDSPMNAWLELEKLFLLVPDEVYAAATLADRLNQPALAAEIDVRRDWAARLESLASAWTQPGELARHVWARLLAAALTGNSADLPVARRYLVQSEQAVHEELEAASRALRAGKRIFLGSLRDLITQHTRICKEIEQILEHFPYSDHDLPSLDVLKDSRHLIDALDHYQDLVDQIDDLPSLDALRRSSSEITPSLQRIEQLCARLEIEPPFKGSAEGLNLRVQVLGESFNYLNEFVRTAESASEHTPDERFAGWDKLGHIVQELATHWSEHGLPQSAGLAQAVLQRIWTTLETLLGDGLSHSSTQPLEATTVLHRLEELKNSEDDAIRTFFLVKRRFISPDSWKDDALVDEFATALPAHPPAGKRASSTFAAALRWRDLVPLLDASRARLPGWTQRLVPPSASGGA